REEDRRVIESGQAIPHQVWLVPVKSGGLGTFVSSKIPLRGPTGQVIGVAGVMYRLDADGALPTPPDRLHQATEMIARRFDQPLEVSEMAKAVNLSISQLNRRFRATYQMSPSEYLQRVRVHEASRLLAGSSLSIGEVALRTGFYDQAHLTRMFRKWMGMTPTDFRKESRH
ncbi:MAG: AraC family transcriptional regulator, partial [Pirellulales bacterium]|nr:AraC family transcriptional regulator [Pirellulales bacterium]